MNEAQQSGLRSEAVRVSNLSTILRELHLLGPASRSDLVARTGLSRSAVGALVNELVELGYAREERALADGSPGRPSPIVAPQSHQQVVLGVEVLVDSIAVAAVGLGGVILQQVRRDRPRAAMPVDSTVRDLAALMKQVMGDLDPACRLHGVGIAVAGLVRRSDNCVLVAPNIGWHDVLLGDLIGTATGLDVPVVVANDADLVAVAESRRGVAVGLANVLCVSGEVGVGGGLIAGGVSITGSTGLAGEVGHMPVNPAGRTCRCGAIGCWETEIGEEALLSRAGRPPAGGRAATNSVLADASRGIEPAASALAEVGRWLGIGLTALINVLGPEVVVLSGLLGRSYPFVAATMTAELDKRLMHAIRETVVVLPSMLGGEAALLGAAELAWDTALADPARAAHSACPRPHHLESGGQIVTDV